MDYIDRGYPLATCFLVFEPLAHEPKPSRVIDLYHSLGASVRIRLGFADRTEALVVKKDFKSIEQF